VWALGALSGPKIKALLGLLFSLFSVVLAGFPAPTAPRTFKTYIRLLFLPSFRAPFPTDPLVGFFCSPISAQPRN